MSEYNFISIILKVYNITQLHLKRYYAGAEKEIRKM